MVSAVVSVSAQLGGIGIGIGICQNFGIGTSLLRRLLYVSVIQILCILNLFPSFHNVPQSCSWFNYYNLKHNKDKIFQICII